MLSQQCKGMNKSPVAMVLEWGPCTPRPGPLELTQSAPLSQIPACLPQRSCSSPTWACCLPGWCSAAGAGRQLRVFLGPLIQFEAHEHPINTDLPGSLTCWVRRSRARPGCWALGEADFSQQQRLLGGSHMQSKQGIAQGRGHQNTICPRTYSCSSYLPLKAETKP